MIVVVAVVVGMLVAVAAMRPTTLHRLAPARADSAPRRTTPRDPHRDEDIVAAIAAGLRAGLLPDEAVRDAGQDADLPATTIDGLRSHASLGWCALLLDISRDTGAAAADPLDRLAARLARRRELHALVRIETSAPRATALLLAALPLMTWWAGALMGASPLPWLVSTPIGRACGIAGLGLEALGIIAIVRMSRAVART